MEVAILTFSPCKPNPENTSPASSSTVFRLFTGTGFGASGPRGEGARCWMMGFRRSGVISSGVMAPGTPIGCWGRVGLSSSSCQVSLRRRNLSSSSNSTASSLRSVRRCYREWGMGSQFGKALDGTCWSDRIGTKSGQRTPGQISPTSIPGSCCLSV